MGQGTSSNSSSAGVVGVHSPAWAANIGNPGPGGDLNAGALESLGLREYATRTVTRQTVMAGVLLWLVIGLGSAPAGAAPNSAQSNYTLMQKLTRLQRLLGASGAAAQTQAISLRSQITADRASTDRGRTGRQLAIEASNAVVGFLGLDEKIRLMIAQQLAQGKQVNWFAAAALRGQQDALGQRARTLIRQARMYLA